MGSAEFQFWFEFASTYSYPAAERVERVTMAAGVALTWKPFLLGPVFQQQGWNDSPFNIYPAKGRYMWRDLERLCERAGLPFRRPSRFPRNGLSAARVALYGSGSSWCGEFVRRVYRANFAEDRDIGETAVLAEILSDLGLDPPGVLAASSTPSNKTALREQTDAAMRLGIFGAPTFVVGQELFWGNDRLEDALDWHERVLTGAAGGTE